MNKLAAILIVLLIAVGIVVVLCIAGFFWYVSQFNHVVTLNETVKEKWGNVESALTRRFDLIPNLVNTVKGYAAHEKELFEHVADVRKSYFQPNATPEEKIKAANEMSGLLSRLLLLQENYPELKANQNFLTLQSQLEGAENRIKFERDKYNEAVRNLNTCVKSFFGRYFARKAKVVAAPFYEAPTEAQTAPKVQF